MLTNQNVIRGSRSGRKYERADIGGGASHLPDELREIDTKNPAYVASWNGCYPDGVRFRTVTSGQCYTFTSRCRSTVAVSTVRGFDEDLTFESLPSS
jgi:hypothetical protein